jgi:hypothetical protein
MKFILFFLSMAFIGCGYADTMDHYMNIANNIPQMELKADPQSQAWARSARTVLSLTCDSIMETLNLANDTAKAHGNPLFCTPPGISMSADQLNSLIQQTYKDISSQQSDKDKMTVSQVALLGLSKQYPCQQQPQQTPSGFAAPTQQVHVDGLP